MALAAGNHRVIVALILAGTAERRQLVIRIFLVAFGCGTFLVAFQSQLPCRVLPFRTAFLATVAYSIYLSHKLSIHWIEDLCTARFH